MQATTGASKSAITFAQNNKVLVLQYVGHMMLHALKAKGYLSCHQIRYSAQSLISISWTSPVTENPQHGMVHLQKRVYVSKLT